MEKYKTEFKLQVVNSFLEGEGGAKLLARRWKVPEEKIRAWVSHYRLHGIDGLRPKRSAYSSEFKLQVLLHQDRERLSSRRVAAIYDIRNPNQVVVWRRDLAEGDAQDLGNTMPKPDTKPEQHCSDTSPAYFSPSWTAFQAERGRDFSVIVDGISN